MGNIARLRDAEISNGNLIDADDIAAELNQIVSAYNANDTILTNLTTGTYTLSGVKTFSSTPKMDAISERSAGSGVTVDGVLLKDSMATLSGVPSAAGMVGYDSDVLKYHNGSAVVDLGYSVTAVTARSSNTILAAADIGTFFVCTSTFTQTLTAAATLGAKWFVDLRNDGTGIITLDPNGAETIDGLATIKMYPGESFRLICDGANFKTVGRQKTVIISSQTASSSATLDFETGHDDTEFDYIEYTLQDVLPATDGAVLWCRVKDSTYQSDGTDYEWSIDGIYGGSSDATSSSADSEIEITRAGHSPGNAANEGYSGTVKLFKPSSSAHKRLTHLGQCKRTDGSSCTTVGGGDYIGSTNAITGFRFLFSAGAIASGKITARGYRA